MRLPMNGYYRILLGQGRILGSPKLKICCLGFGSSSFNQKLVFAAEVVAVSVEAVAIVVEAIVAEAVGS